MWDDVLARLDAIDRDGLEDTPEEWREFEERVEKEMAERRRDRKGKGKAVDRSVFPPPDHSNHPTFLHDDRDDDGEPPLFDTTQSSPRAPAASAASTSQTPSTAAATRARSVVPPIAGPSRANGTHATSTSGPSRLNGTNVTPSADLSRIPGTRAAASPAVVDRTPTRPTGTLTLGPAPSVQTPTMPPPLPSPPLPPDRTRTFDTPVNVPTPTQTPGSVGSRRRDDPSTPVPIASDALSELRNRKDFQNLSRLHEDFLKKTKLLVDNPPGRGQARGRGRGGGLAISRTSTMPLGGLGKDVLKGLRFVIATDKKQVHKHKQYWDVISKLGGTVVLQPDTAITHVIYDPGRNASAAMLARELGVSSLADLPEGTVVVKYDWVAQCKLHGKLLDTQPWLSFKPTTLTRAATTSLAPQRSRMEDITHQLRGHTGAFRRKRNRTPSDSEGDSSLSQQRARRRAPPSSPSEPPTPAKKRTKTAVGAVNTRHSVTPGPGWQAPAAGEEDGLDIMITGVLKGHVEELSDAGSQSDAGSDRSDNERGNPNPMADRFKCGQKHDGTAKGGPNEWLAKEFDQLFSLYEGDKVKSSFAIQGYQKTAGILRRTSYPITSGAQARKIKGIGESMAQRIDEFLTGAKGRAYYENTEAARTIAVFKDIFGVGKNLANTLYQRGARSIEDLRTKDYGLTAGQKIGVELYEDLCSRIPREECRQLFEKIRAAALAIDPKLWIEIMGSYRRGEESSGDVDILFTRDPSDGITHTSVLRNLVQSLHRQGVITHNLSVPHDWSSLEAKWMGVGRASVDGKHRRIDILCIPYEQWGAALLYFTGNAVFNRSIRLYARKKGYSLNQRGLFRGVMRDRKGTKTTEGELIASRTEQEIFDVLGIRWREPQHRRP